MTYTIPQLVALAADSTSATLYEAESTADGIHVGVRPSIPTYEPSQYDQNAVILTGHVTQIKAWVEDEWGGRAHEQWITDPDDVASAVEQAAEMVRVAMRSTRPQVLHDLDAVAEEGRALRQTLSMVDARRDQLILDALTAGLGAPTIATHAGLTTARIYQIRDRTR